MRPRPAAPALAACIACFACGGEPEGPRISETPTRLEFVRDIEILEDGTLMIVPGKEHAAAWHEEVAAELRRIQRMGGGRQWIQGHVNRVDGSSILVTAGPPDLVERGMELWRMDLSSGEIRRYEYGEPFVGCWIAVDGPRIFTSHLDSGAILEYRIPDGE